MSKNPHNIYSTHNGISGGAGNASELQANLNATQQRQQFKYQNQQQRSTTAPQRRHNRHHHHRPPIVVHDHDVLSGRGVNIAHHPGNERFRTLVTTHADESYCSSYTASEKRAVAEQIIIHLQKLDPPGRFLRRDGRGQISRGLNGPWEELTRREAIKKTCQALRDCNRQDRQGYAATVQMPPDVAKHAETRAKSGLSGKEHASQAAAAAAKYAATVAVANFNHPIKNEQPNATASSDVFLLAGVPAGLTSSSPNTTATATTTATTATVVTADATPVTSPTVENNNIAASSSRNAGKVSPSVENAAEWLQKQRTDENATAAAAAAAAAAAFPNDTVLNPPPPQIPETSPDMQEETGASSGRGQQSKSPGSAQPPAALQPSVISPQVQPWNIAAPASPRGTLSPTTALPPNEDPHRDNSKYDDAESAAALAPFAAIDPFSSVPEPQAPPSPIVPPLVHLQLQQPNHDQSLSHHHLHNSQQSGMVSYQPRTLQSQEWNHNQHLPNPVQNTDFQNVGHMNGTSSLLSNNENQQDLQSQYNLFTQAQNYYNQQLNSLDPQNEDSKSNGKSAAAYHMETLVGTGTISHPSDDEINQNATTQSLGGVNGDL